MRKFLRKIVQHRIDRHTSLSPNLMKGDPRLAQEGDYIDWMNAVDERPFAQRSKMMEQADLVDWMEVARAREYKVWLEIDFVLRQLRPHWPRRVKFLTKELRWMRREAFKHGFEWGAERG